MAYSTSTAPGKIAQKNGSNGRTVWSYVSADAIAVVGVADYFSNGDALGMQVGDVIIVTDSDTGATTIQTVSAVTAGGAASISGGALEVTETAGGTVGAGISEVQLNHATVIAAATIADASLHEGIFVVVNTSASGTAAHTLTLTLGTFDGTNNVATLNAPAEMLVVIFDNAGNGRIIQNTGAVALS
jgi:hypothetical protein